MEPSQLVESRDLEVAILSLHHFHQRMNHGNGNIILINTIVAKAGYILSELADILSLGVGLDALKKPLKGFHREVRYMLLVCSYY